MVSNLFLYKMSYFMRDCGEVYTHFRLKQNVFSWSDLAKLFGLYLVTCQHCNCCFRRPIGYIDSDLNRDKKQVDKALRELGHDQFIIRCKDTGWTLIRNFLKCNPIENPNQGKTAIRQLKDVPFDFVGMTSLFKSLAIFQTRLPEEFLLLFIPTQSRTRNCRMTLKETINQ